MWPFRYLHVRVRGLRVRMVKPLLSIYALHQEILGQGSAEARVALAIAGLESCGIDWDIVDLNQLSQNGEFHAAWGTAASESGWKIGTSVGKAPPYLAIDCTWDAFLRRQSANFRSNLKRKARKLHEGRRCRIDFIRNPESMEAAFDAVEKVECQSWKADDGTSLMSRPWEMQFYRNLIEIFARNGQAMITLLTLDDEPVAYDMGVDGGRRVYCLKTSFDQRYRDLSPGLVLRAELMRKIFEEGMHEYDFLGDRERYKLEWTDTTRVDVSMTVMNTSHLRGRVVAAAFNAATVARSCMSCVARLTGSADERT